MQMGEGWFVLSEALSDNLYLKFSHVGEKYYCEVIKLEDEVIMECEMR